LELPIDHYRLLGVSPTSDGQSVLRSLQQRLDHPPQQGFSHEALQARAELLRSSADLLSDEERRHAYEADLSAFQGSGGAGAPGLDLPSSKEVGGLVLLMEAGQPLDAFEIARHSLQPPQTPALGSSREADLTLLVGITCLHAAADLRRERHFEAAASLLLQGRQLLQRMGQAPEQRRQLDQELDNLLPFRVLDLLSRDLTATTERQEGLRWLDVLVKKRGGLEGDGDPELPRQEFQAFFKQIRQFLTVQEQVDLFGRWSDEGSATAEFLASYALTASGFAQRKPERIAAAHQRLTHSGQPGVGPYLACQHLLLGRIDAAQATFQSTADPDLRRWAEQQSDDPLAQLCAYCRDWLSREVLPGYRDIETDADLDAYFADRDIQSYVEGQDRPVGTANWPGPLDVGSAGSSGPRMAPDPFLPPAPPPAPAPRASTPRRSSRRAGWLIPAALGLAGAAVAGGAWFAFRPLNLSPAPPKAAATAKPEAVAPKPTGMPATGPLRASEPSDAEIKGLLEAWLKAKAEVLAGQPPSRPLTDLARPALVASAKAEARQLASRRQQRRVKADVEQFAVVSRSPRRIETSTKLLYSEQTTNAAGSVVDQTAPITLRNSYVFGRDDGIWRLAAWRPRR
jgi:hypothetical protein